MLHPDSEAVVSFRVLNAEEVTRISGDVKLISLAGISGWMNRTKKNRDFTLIPIPGKS
jgi:hypothetical protein